MEGAENGGGHHEVLSERPRQTKKKLERGDLITNRKCVRYITTIFIEMSAHNFYFFTHFPTLCFTVGSGILI